MSSGHKRGCGEKYDKNKCQIIKEQRPNMVKSSCDYKKKYFLLLFNNKKYFFCSYKVKLYLQPVFGWDAVIIFFCGIRHTRYVRQIKGGGDPVVDGIAKMYCLLLVQSFH